MKRHIRKESEGGTEELDDEAVIEKLHRLKQGMDNDFTNIDSTDNPKEAAQIEIQGKDLRIKEAKVHKDNEYRFVLFNLDHMTFAISINNIQEVVDDMPSTKVPYVEDYIEGVINLRGYIVPVISLRKRLNFVGGMDKGGQIMIILKDNDRIGLKLDEVHSVETLDREKIHISEEALLGLDHAFIEGITKKDDRLVLILKPDVLLERNKLVNHR
ncbi:MAG TPA: purine-binding chemotaxis protein CheW [Spirochaetes bacterium]|nr:purine-binding chemotaxis protein CheW [Spirochaetota bacterium]